MLARRASPPMFEFIWRCLRPANPRDDCATTPGDFQSPYLPLFALGWLLIRWRRQGQSDAFVLGQYLIFAGGLRFAIEFVRVNERGVGPLTVAHLASLAAMSAGAYIGSRSMSSSRRMSPPG